MQMKRIIVTIVLVAVVALVMSQKKEDEREWNKAILNIENFELLKDFIVENKLQTEDDEGAEIKIGTQTIMLSYSVNVELELINIDVSNQEERVLFYFFGQGRLENNNVYVDVWTHSRFMPSKKFKRQLLENLDQILKEIKAG